jgi:hypothetical protein
MECAMRIRDDLARVKRKTLLDVECLARDHTQKAIRELLRIMNDENVAANVRVLAAEKILELGWGKVGEMPAPALEMTGSNGGNDH